MVFRGQPVPSWEELYAAFERRVARHPKTTFIGVHFGNDPEDPDHVAQMLDKYPNLYIDTAARVPEIGRQDAAKMRLFYEKYQDRILFGTDLGVAAEQDGMMYGSNAPTRPPWRMRRATSLDLALLRDARQAVRKSHAYSGALEIDGVVCPRPFCARSTSKTPPHLEVAAAAWAGGGAAYRAGPAPAPASRPRRPRPKNEPRHEPATPSHRELLDVQAPLP